MSLEALKEELRELNSDEQRRLIAYLISLLDAQDADYKEKLAKKINDKDPSHFATLDEMDKRLGILENGA